MRSVAEFLDYRTIITQATIRLENIHDLMEGIRTTKVSWGSDHIAPEVSTGIDLNFDANATEELYELSCNYEGMLWMNSEGYYDGEVMQLFLGRVLGQSELTDGNNAAYYVDHITKKSAGHKHTPCTPGMPKPNFDGFKSEEIEEILAFSKAKAQKLLKALENIHKWANSMAAMTGRINAVGADIKHAPDSLVDKRGRVPYISVWWMSHLIGAEKAMALVSDWRHIQKLSHPIELPSSTSDDIEA